MDDNMILDDEIYNKMQQEYDKLNVSTRALRGTLPFILTSENTEKEQTTTKEPLEKKSQDKCAIAKYCHIFAVCYEVSERLKPNGNMYLIMRLREVLDRIKDVVEDILCKRYDICPELKYPSQDVGRDWRDNIWDTYYESVGLVDGDIRDMIMMQYLSLAVSLACDIR